MIGRVTTEDGDTITVQAWDRAHFTVMQVGNSDIVRLDVEDLREHIQLCQSALAVMESAETEGK